MAALATTIGDVVYSDAGSQTRIPVLVDDRDTGQNHVLSYLLAQLAVQLHQQHDGAWYSAEAWTRAARSEPLAFDLRELICSTTLRAAALRDATLAPFRAMACWVDTKLLHASWQHARAVSCNASNANNTSNPSFDILCARTDPSFTALPSQPGQGIRSLASTITVTLQDRTLALTHSLATTAIITHLVLTLPQRATKATNLQLIERCTGRTVLATVLPDDYPLTPLYFKLPTPCTTTSMMIKLEFDEPPSTVAQNSMQSCVCGSVGELDTDWEQLLVDSLQSQLPDDVQLIHSQQGLVAHVVNEVGIACRASEAVHPQPLCRTAVVIACLPPHPVLCVYVTVRAGR